MAEVTDPKVAFVFNTLAKAGVRMIDFARVTRITRETLYRWKGGGNITDELRRDIAYSYALRLDKAVAAGKLPFTDKLKKNERMVALRKIIAETMTELSKQERQKIVAAMAASMSHQERLEFLKQVISDVAETAAK